MTAAFACRHLIHTEMSSRTWTITSFDIRRTVLSAGLAVLISLSLLPTGVRATVPPADHASVSYGSACCGGSVPLPACCPSGAGEASACIGQACGPTADDQNGTCRRICTSASGGEDQSCGSGGEIKCIQSAAPTADSDEEPLEIPANPRLSIDIPTVRFTDAVISGSGQTRSIDIPWLADYISGLFRYAIPVAAILAVVMMMIGGLQWLTSAGDAGRVGAAKKRIMGAVVGLMLLVGSYLLFNTVNPNLVLLPALRVRSVVTEEYQYVGADDALTAPSGGDFNWSGSAAPTSSNGSATREGLQAVCQRGSPATPEAFRNVLSTWVSLGRQGAAVYVRGGRTGRTGCTNHGTADWIRNHLGSHSVAFPASASVEDLRTIYQHEMVDKIFAAGRMCGDCVSWTGQLFACGGYNVAIWQMMFSTSGQYFLAQGATCAEAANRVPGGLKFGDVFRSDNKGHMFTYTGGAGLPYEIIEMGGLRGSRTSIPGIQGNMAAINAHASKDAYFAWVDRVAAAGRGNDTQGTHGTSSCRVYRILHWE